LIRGLAIAGALLLAACASTPPAATTNSAYSPRIALGDYKRAPEAKVLAAFTETLTRRLAGLGRDQAVDSLEVAGFQCAYTDGALTLCRLERRAKGCLHTWQAHLTAGPAGPVQAVRPLYDRLCPAEGLLGG